MAFQAVHGCSGRKMLTIPVYGKERHRQTGHSRASMADARRARPVSGEIMTGRAAVSGHAVSADALDVIDADYEVLPPAARPASAARTAARVGAMPSVGGMDMLRKPETAPARTRATRGGPLFWIAGVGVALAAFWVSGGDSLVRRMPLFAAGGQGGVAFSLSGISSRVDISSMARPPMTARALRRCRRWKSGSPAMTAASPAIRWGQPGVRSRRAKDLPFRAGSRCLRTG